MMLTNKEAIKWIEYVANKSSMTFDDDSDETQIIREKAYANIEQALLMAIKALETSAWIPVGERLPDEDGEYLVASGEFIYVYSYGIPLTPMNERNRRRGWYESTSEGDFYMDIDAWMPLPEPYRGDGESE